MERQIIPTPDPKRRWVVTYDGEYVWCHLERYKKYWFFSAWITEYRKMGLKLVSGYKGSIAGVRYDLYQILNYDLDTFDLKKYLQDRYASIIAGEVAERFTDAEIKKIFNRI